MGRPSRQKRLVGMADGRLWWWGWADKSVARKVPLEIFAVGDKVRGARPGRGGGSSHNGLWK